MIYKYRSALPIEWVNKQYQVLHPTRTFFTTKQSLQFGIPKFSATFHLWGKSQYFNQEMHHISGWCNQLGGQRINASLIMMPRDLDHTLRRSISLSKKAKLISSFAHNHNSCASAHQVSYSLEGGFSGNQGNMSPNKIQRELLVNTMECSNIPYPVISVPPKGTPGCPPPFPGLISFDVVIGFPPSCQVWGKHCQWL